MKQIAIVTGASRGIGYALTLELAKRGVNVIATARSTAELQTLQDHAKNQIQIVMGDIRSEVVLNQIERLLKKSGNIDHLYLVNNAATPYPIASLEDIERNDFISSMQTNVEAPHSLAKKIKLKLSNSNGRILNITSYAGSHPTPGAGVYCMTKAAFNQLSDLMRLEWGKEIAVTRVIPGEVDTKMQEEVRNSTHPIKEFALATKENNLLISPDVCAAFLTWLLLDTQRDEFSAKEMWNIYDNTHHSHWKKEGMKIPEPIKEEQKTTNAARNNFSEKNSVAQLTSSAALYGASNTKNQSSSKAEQDIQLTIGMR